MTFACPKCNSSVSREGQRYCYRCGHDLNDFYGALNIEIKDAPQKMNTVVFGSPFEMAKEPTAGEATDRHTKKQDSAPQTGVIESLDLTTDAVPAPADTVKKAKLRVLLPTGDIFDREINRVEIQMGKGPRNDLVIADPAVSSSHALIKQEADGYIVQDLGSRNGTFLNGERIAEPTRLNHGDIIGIGLTKLTFRINDYGETEAISVVGAERPSAPQPPPPLTEASLARAISAERLASAEEISQLRTRHPQKRLFRALLDEKLITEDKLCDLIARTFHIPAVDLNSAQIDEALAASFPARLARERTVFPISRESNKLRLAVADPTELEAVSEAKRETRSDVELRVAPFSQILRLTDLHYGPKLVGVLPSGEKLEYVIQKKDVEIGKATHNNIVLSDPTVSNTHAVIMFRDDGYSIVDLGSRNGTFVNGERLGTQSHTLKHGDAVQLGQTVLTFRNPEETAANRTAILPIEVLEEVRRRAGIASAAALDSGLAPDPHLATPLAPMPAFPSVQSPQPATELADQAGEEKEKKKKKKKKDEKDRLKAAYIGAVSRILAQIMAVVVSAGLAIYIVARKDSPSTPQNPSSPAATTSATSRLTAPGPVIAFSGGIYEPSGVVQVPNSNAVLFVSDASKNQVFYLQVDQSGNQVGDIKPVELGTKVADPESITYGAGYFYIAGSQANPKDGQENALVRFKFDPASQTVVGQAEVVPDLRSWLINNVAELKGEGEKPGLEGGLNIEGIAWDPARERLLLGLRSPFMGTDAMLVPVKLRDITGPFSSDNLILAPGGVLRLALGGLGVRDIQYDTRLKSFLIIAGAPETQRKTDFKLWEWSGDAGSRPREEALLSEDLKPEGVTHLSVDGRDLLFIVGDSNSHLKFDYAQ